MSKYGKIVNDNKGSENMALNEVKITAKALEKRKKRLKTTKRIVFYFGYRDSFKKII